MIMHTATPAADPPLHTPFCHHPTTLSSVALLFICTVFGLVIICQNVIIAVISNAYEKAREDLGEDIRMWSAFPVYLFEVRQTCCLGGVPG